MSLYGWMWVGAEGSSLSNMERNTEVSQLERKKSWGAELIGDQRRLSATLVQKFDIFMGFYAVKN